MAQFIKNRQIQDEFKEALATIDRDWSLNLERQLLDIREKISKQMEKNSLSRADLAKTLGSSRSYVTQLLNGNQNLRLSTLFKVCFALGLKPIIQFKDEQSDLIKIFTGSYVQHEPFKRFKRIESITIQRGALEEKYELT